MLQQCSGINNRLPPQQEPKLLRATNCFRQIEPRCHMHQSSCWFHWVSLPPLQSLPRKSSAQGARGKFSHWPQGGTVITRPVPHGILRYGAFIIGACHSRDLSGVFYLVMNPSGAWRPAWVRSPQLQNVLIRRDATLTVLQHRLATGADEVRRSGFQVGGG